MLNLQGLIIGVTELEDRGRYLKLLTEHGIYEIYARGAKKATSKNNPGTEIFCYTRVSVTPGKQRLTLDSSEVKEQFYNLRTDIKKLSLAAFFAEAVTTSGIGKDGAETLKLLLLCLYHLDKGDRETDLIKAVFELRYACDIGFLPALAGCDICHSYDGFGNGGMSFLTHSGKLLCHEHNPHNDGVLLSPALLHTLRFVCLSDINKICDFKLSEETLKAFAGVAESYLIYHTDKKYKTLGYYNGTE
jgi:DNA repair protein RecO (recombination protein O)